MHMITTSKPSEKVNANSVHEARYPLIKLAMIRYGAIMGYYYDEPCLIHLYPEDNEKNIICERILSFHLDVPNDYSTTYSIYSNSRELFTADWYAIVRILYWDKRADQARIKTFKEEREALLHAWPSIDIKNTVIKQNAHVSEIIFGLDELVERGVIITPRKDVFPFWRDISMVRRYDWGEVRNNWGASHQNERLEAYIHDSMKKLDQISAGVNSTYHKMVIDYQVTPEMFHDAVVGKYASS